MKKTGWKVLDSGADMRIAEFKASGPEDKLLSYEEAKSEALQSLREHIEPYLQRIDELEQDQFRKTGALPQYKAWRSPRTVITAKTKKRAIEVFGWTRYSFDLEFTEAEGDWWYPLATEDAFWLEVKDEQGKGTGQYVKPILHEEAKRLLEEHLCPYRTMSVEDVLSKLDEEIVSTGISSQGTAYTVTTKICPSIGEDDNIVISGRLTDMEGCRASKYIGRKIPKEPVSINWKQEGF